MVRFGLDFFRWFFQTEPVSNRLKNFRKKIVKYLNAKKRKKAEMQKKMYRIVFLDMTNYQQRP